MSGAFFVHPSLRPSPPSRPKADRQTPTKRYQRKLLPFICAYCHAVSRRPPCEVRAALLLGRPMFCRRRCEALSA